MKRAFLLMLGIFLLIGCAPATPTLLDLPYATDIPMKPVELPQAGVALSIATNWTIEYDNNLLDNFYCEGPSRVTGRACMHLIYGTQSEQSLEDLATAAAMLEGVEIPPEPTTVELAGIPVIKSTGVVGPLNKKVVALTWESEDTVYLVLLTWVNEEDGEALGAMARSIKMIPKQPPSATSPDHQ